jgi:hypothetical protein
MKKLLTSRSAIVVVGVLLVAISVWTNARPRTASVDAPAASSWLLETQGGAAATLEHVRDSAGGDVMRVTIARLADPSETWQVKLMQRRFEIEAGVPYHVSFRARAGASRPVGCAVGNNHEPWEVLGVYHEHQVTTDWLTFECSFTASASDADARLFFDLAKDDSWVELTEVVMRDEDAGRLLAPALP